MYVRKNYSASCIVDFWEERVQVLKLWWSQATLLSWASHKQKKSFLPLSVSQVKKVCLQSSEKQFVFNITSFWKTIRNPSVYSYALWNNGNWTIPQICNNKFKHVTLLSTSIHSSISLSTFKGTGTQSILGRTTEKAFAN